MKIFSGFVLGISFVCIAFMSPSIAKAQELPVREIAAFKDGHVLVMQSEKVTVDASGKVILRELPTPILGTFWPFAKNGVQVVSTTAGLEEIAETRPVASLVEVLRANLNNTVTIQEVGDRGEKGEKSEPYSAKVLEVTGDQITLLQTEKGTKVLPIGRIQDIVLPEKGNISVPQPTKKPRLTLQVSGAQKGQAEVGYLSVQKGFRWIPHYRVTLIDKGEGKGNAKVQLQATLVNDLANLSDVTVHLVVGVPTFVMKNEIDPISLQETVAQVAAQEFGNRNMMLNSQVGFGGYGANRVQSDPAGTDPTVIGGAKGEKQEDLFLFTVKNISLKKGERMTIPINEVTVPYKDVYTLDIFPTPPVESYRNYTDGNLPAELERLRQQPQALHKLRLTNSTTIPLTTAPALIFKEDQVLAQGLMTYTPKGGKSDLTLTNAVDIGVKRSDIESKRTDFVRSGSTLTTVEMKGLIEVTNYRTEPIEIEVNRYVSGLMDTILNTGLNTGTLSALDPISGDAMPDWWMSVVRYGFNYRDGLGKATWTISVKPEESVKLGYTWHYTRG